MITYRHKWLPWQEAFLRLHYANTLTVDLAQVLQLPIKKVLTKANAMGLHKSVELIADTARERNARPDNGNRRTRFQPGQAPANKGSKGITGVQPECRATQFKPGQKPHTWLPIGSYRICEGQLQRKVNDLPGSNHVRWHPVSRLVWEEAHGPVPAGSIVCFKPGQATAVLEQITLDRLELLTRAELLTKRNGVHAYGPEIAAIHHLRGAITRQINNRNQG